MVGVCRGGRGRRELGAEGRGGILSGGVSGGAEGGEKGWGGASRRGGSGGEGVVK